MSNSYGLINHSSSSPFMVYNESTWINTIQKTDSIRQNAEPYTKRAKLSDNEKINDINHISKINDVEEPLISINVDKYRALLKKAHSLEVKISEYKTIINKLETEISKTEKNNQDIFNSFKKAGQIIYDKQIINIKLIKEKECLIEDNTRLTRENIALKEELDALKASITSN